MSELLSTQLSLGTMSTQGRGSQAARSRRSDIQPTGALERYLASDLNSQQDQRSNILSSVADAGVPLPVIWGTTVTIEDSMTMFRDFITNYTLDDEELDATPYYETLLQYVINQRLVRK